MCDENRECKCIGDILRAINILQRKAERIEEAELDTCDRGTLGSCCEPIQCNTRPIQLFLAGHNGNDPLVMPTTRDEIEPSTCFSNVFRVEKVDECCCTCRVLKRRKMVDSTASTECNEFQATNSFFTLDLHCVCAIRCLEDTFVECI